jgi:hypothetical protein
VRANVGGENMLMNHNGTKLTVAMALALTVIAVMIVYPQQLPEEKLPDCKCVYPNTKQYGIIKNGNCIVTKCKRKAPEK